MASERPYPVASPAEYVSSDPGETTLVMPVARRKRRWPRVLLLVLLVLLLIIGAAGAALYEVPSLLVPVGSAVLGDQPGTVAWNGTDPLNILVMGIDPRTNEAPHSDTMIVLRVDPSSHHVTMLSVPRDLYINMPGNYGYSKINAAITLGYNAVVAQQGLQAAEETGAQYAQLAVESALGIPINYYAVLRFSGFKSVVDALGGVTVCVPHEINDPTYPADVGYGYNPIDIKAGCQKMNGTVALEYARERHVYAQQDLNRIQAQQALMAGMEKQMLTPGTLFRFPSILSAVNGSVITDLPHGALPELGLLLGRAKGNNTQHVYINADGGYVTDTMMDGQDVLAGNWPRINALVTSLFADSRLRAEHATVQVRNGQHTPGLAAMYTTILQGDGFTTVAPRDADKSTYQRNLVIVNQDLPGADYTARKLAQMLQADVTYRHIGTDHAQVVAILGSDAAEGS